MPFSVQEVLDIRTDAFAEDIDVPPESFVILCELSREELLVYFENGGVLPSRDKTPDKREIDASSDPQYHSALVHALVLTPEQPPPPFHPFAVTFQSSPMELADAIQSHGSVGILELHDICVAPLSAIERVFDDFHELGADGLEARGYPAGLKKLAYKDPLMTRYGWDGLGLDWKIRVR